jgi:Cation transporter/ATPase, N-terminus
LPGTRVAEPWTVPAEAVADELGTDPATGLTAAEAADRLRRVGPNALVERGASRPGGCWPSSSPTP